MRAWQDSGITSIQTVKIGQKLLYVFKKENEKYSMFAAYCYVHIRSSNRCCSSSDPSWAMEGQPSSKQVSINLFR